MALGTEATANGTSLNWREIVSTIREAGKVLDKEIDPQSLRDFVRSISNYKEQYANSKEVMREVLHQISALKNCPYLQPYVFEPSTDLSKPHGEILDSSHYDEAVRPETGNYYSEGAASKAQRSFYYADNRTTNNYNNYDKPNTNTTNNKSREFPSSLSSSNLLIDENNAPPTPSVTTSPPQSRPKVRNWSLEFWRALELRFNSPDESWNRSTTIKRIATDFCAVATRHGRTIISEMFLPATVPRTIPPVDAGGLAGGLKYVKDGIFFKFAVDNLGIYAGDHNAMKAAGHELKGLAAFMNCQIPGLRVPLMAIVDYRGFRLIATSSLPISSAVPEISPSSMFETQQQIQQQLQKQIDHEMQALNDQAPFSPPTSPHPFSPTTPLSPSMPSTPLSLDSADSPQTPSTPPSPSSPPTPPTPRNQNFERPEEHPPNKLPTEHPKSTPAHTPSPYLSTASPSPYLSTPLTPLTPSSPLLPPSPTSSHNNQGTSLLDKFNSLALSPSPALLPDTTVLIPDTKQDTADKPKKDKKDKKSKIEIEEEEEEREVPTHTLVYGSCDGGNTVYNSDPVMHELIKQAAAILNLKLHTVGSKLKASIYGPCDLEGHKIRDGEYVIIDTARTFPPERPSVNSHQGAHLIRLLRPELVRSHRVPLSSDAFTSFGSSDPLQSTHNKEAEQAQQRLVCEIIPNFVLAANQKVKKMDQNCSIFEVSSQLSLIDSLHREGINVRYLPALKRTDLHGLDLKLSTIINTEIMARRAKNRLRAHLRADLRETASKNKEGSEVADFTEKEIAHLVDFLNSTIIAAELQGQEMDGLSIPLLVDRLTAMSGIHLSTEVPARLDNGGILTASDIVSVTPRVRYIHTVPYQEGVALFHQAGTHPPNEAKQLLTVAEQKFKTALNAKPDDPAILTHWGILLVQKARLYTDIDRQKQLLERAVEKFKEAVTVKRNHHYALFNWAEALREWSRISAGKESEALLNQATTKMREAGVFQKKWFFGTLPTNGAAGLLARQPPHAFFVRNSNTRPGHFVFSHLTRDRKIKHTLILYNAQGKYTLARHAAQAYDTLEDFVMAKINEGYTVVTKKWWD